MTTPTGPSLYSTTIDTGTDKGLALARVTRMANAVGAAMDALEAAGTGEEPSQSTRVQELGTLYASLIESVQQAGREYEGYSAYAADHVSKGEITEPTVVSREREEFRFDQTTEW